MRHHLLIATVLYATFAFQLLLAGVGEACVMPAADTVAGRTSSGEMAGMGMTGMHGAPARGQDKATSGGSGHDGTPCNQSLPAAACQVMAPCTGVFVAIATAVNADPVRTSARVATLVIAIPASRTTAPELPPPRA